MVWPTLGSRTAKEQDRTDALVTYTPHPTNSLGSIFTASKRIKEQDRTSICPCVCIYVRVCMPGRGILQAACCHHLVVVIQLS